MTESGEVVAVLAATCPGITSPAWLDRGGMILRKAAAPERSSMPLGMLPG